MQLQGLMMMLFFTIVIPLIIMSANDNVFFILIALVLFIASLKDARNIMIHLTVFKDKATNIDIQDSSDEKEIIEELEDMTNINIKKFSTGIIFVKGFTLVLFFIYCAVHVNNLYLRILISSMILYWIHQTINIVSAEKGNLEKTQTLSKLKLLLAFCIDIATIFIIIVVTYNKFINYRI